MHKSNPYLAAALRGTFLFLSAWFMVKLTGSDPGLSALGQTTFFYLLISGLVTGIVWVCLLRALQLGEVIKVVPIVEANTALTLLVGIFLFHDSVTWNKVIVILLLFAGAFMMGWKGQGRGGSNGSWMGYAIGAMILTTVTAVLEQIGFASINTYYERLVRYTIAFVVVWVVTFATRGYKGLRALSFLDGIYLCLSGISMGGAWYCFHQAYRLGINENVDWVAKFDLVAVIFLGCVFMRERTTLRAVFGMIFMMLGFWILQADLPVIPL